MSDLQLLPEDSASQFDAADWGMRIGVAVFFFIFGSEKFSNDPHSSWVKMFQQIGWGDWFRYFTGVVEMGGALLVLIPRSALVGFALCGCAMAGAVAVHIFILRDGATAIVPGIILAVLAGIAYLHHKAS